MKFKKSLYVLVGIPGSGKSTFAEKMRDNASNAIIVSRDKIRFSILQEGDRYFDKERRVWKEYIKQIVDSLISPEYLTVIADATHLNMNSRGKLINAIASIYPEFYNEVGVSFIYFNTPLNTCVERNNRRSGREKVPVDVIQNMAKQLQYPAALEYENQVATYVIAD